MKPWQSREEMLVDIAMENALASVDHLRAMGPPEWARPVGAVQHHAATIEDVLGLDRRARNNRSWLSGMPVRRSVMSDQSWSGTARNALSEGAW